MFTIRDFVVIGTVGISIEQELHALLKADGIVVETGEGGLCHQILVLREQAEEAARLIRKSSLNHKITLYEEPRDAVNGASHAN